MSTGNSLTFTDFKPTAFHL